MKYKEIIESPDELLLGSEKDFFESNLELVERIKADKLNELSAREVFDLAMFICLKKEFAKKRYILYRTQCFDEGEKSDKRDKNSPPEKLFKKYNFTYRLMKHSFGLKEKNVHAVSGKSLLEIADKMTSVVVSRAYDEEAKAMFCAKCLKEVEEIEEMLEESKE